MIITKIVYKLRHDNQTTVKTGDTYNLAMIQRQFWRKSWELVRWPSRWQRGEIGWSVRGPWWLTLVWFANRAGQGTWHHTQCPLVYNKRILTCMVYWWIIFNFYTWGEGGAICGELKFNGLHRDIISYTSLRYPLSCLYHYTIKKIQTFEHICGS